MYRVGLPGWKIAARAGIPLLVRVDVHYDPDVKSYWTTSPDLVGLIVTGNSIDELLNEAKIGMNELIELAIKDRRFTAAPQLNFSPEALCAA